MADFFRTRGVICAEHNGYHFIAKVAPAPAVQQQNTAPVVSPTPQADSAKRGTTFEQKHCWNTTTSPNFVRPRIWDECPK